MPEINEDRLVMQSVTGEITHPLKNRSPYVVSAEGEAQVLPGVGGIVYNARVGDNAVDWEADHVEPGASFSHLQDKAKRQEESNYAFNVLSCVGNSAVMISGDAEGEEGTVVGKHGGIEHVMVDFPQEVLEQLRVGDTVQVKSHGVGMEFKELASVKIYNCSPRLIEALDLTISDDVLEIPVAHTIPARIMGSGLGADNSVTGDYDIQMFDQSVVEEYGLNDLRFGDFVAIMDADNSYGRIYRSGSVTVGVVVHSRSVKSGHGPGVSTLFTSREGDIEPIEDEDANLAHVLDLREDW